MTRKLERVTDWAELARSSGYSVKEIAAATGTSMRQLRRHFRRTQAMTLREYLQQLRQAAGRAELQRTGCVAKAAQAAAYTRPSDYSRAFKRFHGYSPHELSADSYSI